MTKHKTRRKAKAAPPAAVQTLMEQTRKSRGLTLAEVADAVGTNSANMSRVEKGKQMPKRELARDLYRFYDGVIELGLIYDPTFTA